MPTLWGQIHTIFYNFCSIIFKVSIRGESSRNGSKILAKVMRIDHFVTKECVSLVSTGNNSECFCGYHKISVLVGSLSPKFITAFVFKKSG